MSNGIKGKEQDNKFFTVEFFGVTLIISSFLLLVCLLFGDSILFELGKEIQCSLLGLFGYFSYPLLLSVLIVGFMMLFGKKPSKSSSILTVLRLAFTLVLILCLFTTITNLSKPSTLEEYLSNAYNSGRLGLEKTVTGGALFSLITFYAVKYLTYVGSIILFALMLLINLIISFKRFKKSLTNPKVKVASEEQPKTSQPMQPVESAEQVQPAFFNAPNYNSQNGYPYNNPNYQNPNPQYNQPNDFNHGSGYYGGFSVPQSNSNPYVNAPSKEDAMRILYGNAPRTYSSEYNRSFMEDKVRVGGANVEPNKFNSDGMISSPISKEEINPTYTFEDKSNSYESIDEYEDNSFVDVDNDSLKYEPSAKSQPSFLSDFFKKATKTTEDNEVTVLDLHDTEEVGYDKTSEIIEEPPKPTVKKVVPTISKPVVEKPVVEDSGVNESATFTSEYSKYLIENMPLNIKYNKPPVTLLSPAENVGDDYQFEIYKAEIKNKILETLNNFGVTTQIADIHRGPAVTRFDIEVPPSIAMNKITQRQGDINLRVAAISPIRMIAPVPGTSYVGIEVANRKRDKVALRDIVSSDSFISAEDDSITFALGKNIIGEPVSLDITKMPHLLIAGSTGSGKSVCLNSLMVSLLMKYSPEQLRIIIVDPKGVEFDFYEKIPHLYFGEIVKDDIPMTNAVLGWVVEEMARRYAEFSNFKVKDLKSYNKKARLQGAKTMPRIVMIIDEFADIMLKDKNGANTKICLLAQKSRAAGIHLILATQRPSADIIEGPIKTNLPSRIVFKVSSNYDSMTCMGEPGAEKLLGYGDGLYKTEGMFAYERFMGAYLSDDEIVEVVDYVKEHNKGYFDYNAWSKILASVNQNNEISSESNYDGSDSGSVGGSDTMDPLNIKAMQIGYDSGGLSTSFLQRKLGVGYPRAAKIIDWLTDNGYITPNSVSGKKQMILPREEFEEKFGGGSSAVNGDTEDV